MLTAKDGGRPRRCQLRRLLSSGYPLLVKLLIVLVLVLLLLLLLLLSFRAIGRMRRRRRGHLRICLALSARDRRNVEVDFGAVCSASVSKRWAKLCFLARLFSAPPFGLALHLHELLDFAFSFCITSSLRAQLCQVTQPINLLLHHHRVSPVLSFFPLIALLFQLFLFELLLLLAMCQVWVVVAFLRHVRGSAAPGHSVLLARGAPKPAEGERASSPCVLCFHESTRKVLRSCGRSSTARY